MNETQWDDVFFTNVKGIFYLTQLIVKSMMKAKWGRIVNISSVVAFTGNVGQVNYCASKSAIIGFTKSLAKEVANANITVNAIAPGFIETDMVKSISDSIKQQILEKIPASRIWVSLKILQILFCFLVSDVANYITGSTLHVNGGLYMA